MSLWKEDSQGILMRLFSVALTRLQCIYKYLEKIIYVYFKEKAISVI